MFQVYINRTNVKWPRSYWRKCAYSVCLFRFHFAPVHVLFRKDCCLIKSTSIMLCLEWAGKKNVNKLMLNIANRDQGRTAINAAQWWYFVINLRSDIDRIFTWNILRVAMCATQPRTWVSCSSGNSMSPSLENLNENAVPINWPRRLWRSFSNFCSIACTTKLLSHFNNGSSYSDFISGSVGLSGDCNIFFNHFNGPGPTETLCVNWMVDSWGACKDMRCTSPWTNLLRYLRQPVSNKKKPPQNHCTGVS